MGSRLNLQKSPLTETLEALEAWVRHNTNVKIHAANSLHKPSVRRRISRQQSQKAGVKINQHRLPRWLHGWVLLGELKDNHQQLCDLHKENTAFRGCCLPRLGIPEMDPSLSIHFQVQVIFSVCVFSPPRTKMKVLPEKASRISRVVVCLFSFVVLSSHVKTHVQLACAPALSSHVNRKKDPGERTLVSSGYGQGLKEKIPTQLCLSLIENHPRPIRNWASRDGMLKITRTREEKKDLFMSPNWNVLISCQHSLSLSDLPV